MDNRPTLTIIMGPAGSGKSTLAKRLTNESKNPMVYFEADMWMTNSEGEYVFDPSRLGFCHNQCQTSVDASLDRGIDTIVSNTTLRRKDLNVYLDIAKNNQVPVRIIRMRSFYGSIHNVPEEKVEIMKGMMKTFDWTNLPDFVTVEDYYGTTPMQETFESCQST